MADKERCARILNRYRDEIRAKSPKSYAIWQKNRSVMPAGVGSIFRLADPFPMVVKEAKGARVWDADGHEYVDFMLGFSTMILGNAPDEVEAAIREALPRGTHYGQCHEHEYAFAKLFCDMVPGVEKVSFCNSGTEATMYALRLARATTGRPLIAKFEGGYHGTHDLLAVSFCRRPPTLEGNGAAEDPTTVPESPGLSEGAWRDTIVLPYNDPAAFEKIRRHADRLAGVIVEPVQGAGGTIAASKEFLSELRRVTREIGAFLIFDEVITGFRMAAGGAQEYYGILPDVSTYGKVAGGGLPFGAVGGTAEAMRLMEYDRERENAILMAGTFNGNPLAIAAGTAVLRRLSREPQLYAQMNAKGDRFRDEMNAFAEENDYPAVAIGVGSMFWMHPRRGPINGVRDLWAGNQVAGSGLKLLYRKNGLHISSNHGFLSTAHTDEDVTRLIETHKAAMAELRAQGVW
ncbi:MAG: aspartate aminotransferase family protein [Candidatus Promineifilaceae bacterium]|nr:aspartate aminotransferase family protein [Candidatus Promineifilaceae bacterium]